MDGSALVPLASFLFGAFLGAMVAWLASSTRARRAERDGAALVARLQEKEAASARLEAEIETRRREEARAREDRARIEADLANERRASEEKLQLLGQAEDQLREAFQALSAEALRQNNQTFLELAKESLEGFQKAAQVDLGGRQKAVSELVEPVRKSLEQVDAKLQAIEREREGAYQALRRQVEAMTAGQERLRSETAGLSQALKNPSSRGRWGEIQLRRVVELAGMLDHCDFVEQEYFAGEDRSSRPDMVVRLPGDKRLVVDAKVPLDAYLEAQATDDEGIRQQKLDEHARQVRSRVTQLGSKAYWERIQESPEFVILFLPGESFFADAVRRDPLLIEDAVAQRVIPASPTTLISLLKAAYYGWQQQKIADNAREVRDLGIELHDRLQKMSSHLATLGDSLNRAVKSYDQAAGSFERRVLVTARRFQELGAGTSREIPPLDPVGRTVRPLETSEEAPDAEAGLASPADQPLPSQGREPHTMPE